MSTQAQEKKNAGKANVVVSHPRPKRPANPTQNLFDDMVAEKEAGGVRVTGAMRTELWQLAHVQADMEASKKQRRSSRQASYFGMT